MNNDELTDDEITENNWLQYGPLMELSVLSEFPWPDEWRTKYVNNKAVEPVIPPDSITKNKVDFIKNIMDAIKSNFDEIEFKDDLSDKEVELLCDKKADCIFINVNIILGRKRYGRISFKIYNENTSILNTKIYFLDEYDYQFRKEIYSMMNKLMKTTHAFCGTVGLEADVWDIFKLDSLPLNIGDKSNYGIEKIYWNIK